MPTNNRIVQLLDERINAAVNDALESMGIVTVESTNGQRSYQPSSRLSRVATAYARPTTDRRQAEVEADAEPLEFNQPANGRMVSGRKRRHFQRGATIVYAVNKARNGRIPAEPFPESMSTHYRVWAYLTQKRNVGKALDNAAIEAGTGLKKKTVQSVVWFMRNHNADLERITPGPKALLIGRPASASK